MKSSLTPWIHCSSESAERLGQEAGVKLQEEKIMTTAVLSVPASITRRIEKLAKEAGRTPSQMLKFVIRDGLEQTEYAVKEANAGLEELDAGKAVSLNQVRQRVEARRQHRAQFNR